MTLDLQQAAWFMKDDVQYTPHRCFHTAITLGCDLAETSASACLAQAGMVTTLSTRTTIIAATNPKPRWTPLRPLSEATSIAGPLLSRFDVLLVMTDARNKEWDRAVAHHVLQGHQSRVGSSGVGH